MELFGPLRAAEREKRGSERTRHVELLGVAVGWAASRALVVWLFFGAESIDARSLDYIARSVAGEPFVGIMHTLVEYPVPAVGVLSVPWSAVRTLHLPHAYPAGILVLCLLADAAFTLLLVRAPAARRGVALTVWVLAVPLLGATACARLDIVPGVLAGAALLLLVTRPAMAAGAAALAVALKLWPALLIPAMAVPRATRRPVLVGAGVLGAAFAATGFVLDGWSRLVSPLTYQAHRGLQIESVPATAAMVAWAFRPTAGFRVRFSRFQAFEISGPWTHGLLRLSTLLTLVATVGLVALWRAALRRGANIGVDGVVWLSLTGVTACVVTSKVLSPQYLLWLLPLAAAAAALTSSRSVRAWIGVLLVTAALTQLEYPIGYGNLVARTPGTTWTVLVLAVRNLLLVVLAGWAAILAVRDVLRVGNPSAARVAG